MPVHDVRRALCEVVAGAETSACQAFAPSPSRAKEEPSDLSSTHHRML